METERRDEEKPVCADSVERTGSFCTPKSLVIGLTGGIATGKSTVAEMFAKLGAEVLSADEIVHRLLAPGTDVWKQIVGEFGEGILGPDGNIDRKKLGNTVFRDTEKKARLESITHPPVMQYLAREAERFRRHGEGVLILEIPLLIEIGAVDIADKILVVTVEQEIQIKRLQYRYGISCGEALLRINSQLPMQEKIKHADWVISTDGTLHSTREQVYKVWDEVQKSLAPDK